MKDKKNSLGRRLARRFSAAGLYMGAVEIAAIALLLACFMHNRWGAEETFWVLAVMGLCEIVRVILTLSFNRRLTKKALSPLTDIAHKLNSINTNNLSERFAVGEGEEELRQLRGVLNEMLDRIESGYNAQKRFISDASHELRTPISVIQGYADMLGRWGAKDPAVMQESIDAIKSEAAGMKELVDQLLFIARHEGNAYPYEMEFFDVSELVEELARDTRMIDKRHTIDVLASDKCVVRADRAALKQALRVFVDNAIKYTPAGGHIALACVAEKKGCRLTVADDGPGIAHEDLERIFERFYRAPSARGSDVDGHGLGLSIARLIVRAHGGRIEVQSKEGGGSRFHVILPK